MRRAGTPAAGPVAGPDLGPVIGPDLGPVIGPAGGFVGPVKRSITIAGHPTSISLEPLFWRALEQAAQARGVPLSALVATIDALRIAQPDPPNLASALRTWLMATSGNVVESV